MSDQNEKLPCRFRVGYGYDIHRLEPLPPTGAGQPFCLGGIIIPQEYGPVGKTDADTLLHAVTDAILGALALGNMGSLFSVNDSRKASRESPVFLREACRRMRDIGWGIGNLDATIIAERPRLASHLEAIQQNVARLLNVDCGDVSVKVKGHENLDAVGAGNGIEIHVVVLLYKP